MWSCEVKHPAHVLVSGLAISMMVSCAGSGEALKSDTADPVAENSIADWDVAPPPGWLANTRSSLDRRPWQAVMVLTSVDGGDIVSAGILVHPDGYVVSPLATVEDVDPGMDMTVTVGIRPGQLERNGRLVCGSEREAVLYKTDQALGLALLKVTSDHDTLPPPVRLAEGGANALESVYCLGHRQKSPWIVYKGTSNGVSENFETKRSEITATCTDGGTDLDFTRDFQGMVLYNDRWEVVAIRGQGSSPGRNSVTAVDVDELRRFLAEVPGEPLTVFGKDALSPSP